MLNSLKKKRIQEPVTFKIQYIFTQLNLLDNTKFPAPSFNQVNFGFLFATFKVYL